MSIALTSNTRNGSQSSVVCYFPSEVDGYGQRPGVSVGDQVKDVKASFTSACKRAGIKDFRIHDLPHTCASWLVKNGTPLLEVRKLLRHASITMTERYAHLAPDHLHQAAQNLGFTAQYEERKTRGFKMS